MEIITCFTTTKTSSNRPSAIFINQIDSIKEHYLSGSIIHLKCGETLYIVENYTELLKEFENFRKDKSKINFNTKVIDKYSIRDITYMWCENNKTYFRFIDGNEILINEQLGKILYKWGFYNV